MLTRLDVPAIEPREPGSNVRGIGQLEWLDLMKAMALLWIFLNHVSEKLFGAPYFANPDQHWPPLTERIQQLAPITGHGFWGVMLNLMRWVGWAGDEGVQLFLIISGFGLAWGLLRKNAAARLNPFRFYSTRMLRILPLWWVVHVLALLAAIVLGTPGLGDYRFYLSFAGIRVTPELLYYIQPGWWYIGLLLQLYIVFPWLWRVLKEKGPVASAILFIFLPICIRLLGLLYFREYLDAWSRGAVFISRLPEFALGMIFAAKCFSVPSELPTKMTSGRIWCGAAAIYALGFCLSFSLAGMALSTVLLGAGAFFLLLKPLYWTAKTGSRVRYPLLWIGRHSYSLFLIHGIFVRFVVPSDPFTPPVQLAARVILALLLAVAFGFILDWIVERMVGVVKNAGVNKWAGRFS